MQEIKRENDPTSPPLVELVSRYTLDQLPKDRLCDLCDECGVPMMPVLGAYLCNNVPGAKIKLFASNVPLLRCVGEWGGSYYPPEVLADLLEQAVPKLRLAGDEELADSLDSDLLLLREAAQQNPILLDRSNPI